VSGFWLEDIGDRRDRKADVFNLNDGCVFSHLPANWRCFILSDSFYGIDGTTPSMILPYLSSFVNIPNPALSI